MQERASERRENINEDSLFEKSGWKAGTTVTVSQNKCREGSLVQGPCLILLRAPRVWPKALERKKEEKEIQGRG